MKRMTRQDSGADGTWDEKKEHDTKTAEVESRRDDKKRRIKRQRDKRRKNKKEGR